MAILTHRRPPRNGSIIPILAVSIVGLFGFTALAVDLGMLAVSRNHSQHAADIAALSGTRTLNNKPTAINNDLALAVAQAKATATSNEHMSTNFTTAQVQKVEVGQFLYDASVGIFRVSTWTDVTNSQAVTAAKRFFVDGFAGHDRGRSADVLHEGVRHHDHANRGGRDCGVPAARHRLRARHDRLDGLRQHHELQRRLTEPRQPGRRSSGTTRPSRAS